MTQWMKRQLILFSTIIGFFSLVVLLSPNVALADDYVGDDPAPDDCASCHEDAYHDWEMSSHSDSMTNPVFLQSWETAGNPTYCYSCHATGYDAVEGTTDYEGVSCMACHEENTSEDGPHRIVSDSPDLCADCHTGAHAPDYDSWLMSDHARLNIGCADCHQSHNNNLHFSDSEELCQSCHQIEEHGDSAHGQAGMTCTDCHMSVGDKVVDQLSGRTNGGDHSFDIPANVCASCHGMSHTIMPGEGTTVEDPLLLSDALETCNEELEVQATNRLNLGLTGGGIAGLLVGMVIPVVLRKKEKDNE